MEILQAILLGIVEGLTEFLPISSTGHLIVAQDVIGFYDTSRMFTVVIQMGAMAAVVWFYRHELWQLVKGLAAGDKAARRLWLVWVLATIPAGLAGLLFDVRIEAYATSLVVALALIAGGIVMWCVESYHKVQPPKDQPDLQNISKKQAVLIGLYQVLALIPGVSRSGATIMGGLLSGLDRVTATAFSFYLGIPILLLAGGYKLATDDASHITGGFMSLAVGTVASFVMALIAISWLIKYVSRHDFKPFAYYRILLGIVILLLLLAGVLN